MEIPLQHAQILVTGDRRELEHVGERFRQARRRLVTRVMEVHVGEEVLASRLAGLRAVLHISRLGAHECAFEPFAQGVGRGPKDRSGAPVRSGKLEQEAYGARRERDRARVAALRLRQVGSPFFEVDMVPGELQEFAGRVTHRKKGAPEASLQLSRLGIPRRPGEAFF